MDEPGPEDGVAGWAAEGEVASSDGVAIAVLDLAFADPASVAVTLQPRFPHSRDTPTPETPSTAGLNVYVGPNGNFCTSA
jgi:hypothetical protein